jgi:hypothetical protein
VGWSLWVGVALARLESAHPSAMTNSRPNGSSELSSYRTSSSEQNEESGGEDES